MDKDQKHKITKIIGVWDNQYGKKIAFKTDLCGDLALSTLTKYPDKMVEGAEVFGHVDTVEKDGKTYHNFKFGKSGGSSGGTEFAASAMELRNILNLKVIPMLTEILGRLPEAEKIKYPPLDSTNDVSAFDDENLPF